MDETLFETIAREELERVPERFAKRITNVALLIEEEPSAEVRREHALEEAETLLGLYQGIPATERGEGYSGVLPDTITLYRLPILAEAEAILEDRRPGEYANAVRLAIRETLWHEIGHYFGMSEEEVHGREDAGTNTYTKDHE